MNVVVELIPVVPMVDRVEDGVVPAVAGLVADNRTMLS